MSRLPEVDQSTQEVKNQDWYHYSGKLIDSIKPVNLRVSIKPQGLYFAREDEWLHACFEIGCMPQEYKFGYRLKNLDQLKIANEEHIARFAVLPQQPGEYVPRVNWTALRNLGYDGVQLEQAKHPGIYDVDSLVLWNFKLENLSLERDHAYIQAIEDSDNEMVTPSNR